jgi:hydrogenase nickel incorporation protein HypA/HybF
MHEFSITSLLVESLLELARQRGASRVLEVHLRIGKLRALSVDQVRFCYGILVKGTILEGSRLFVRETQGIVRCAVCGYHGMFDSEGNSGFHFGIAGLICPRCANSLTIEGGDECVIARVRMLQPSGPSERT